MFCFTKATILIMCNNTKGGKKKRERHGWCKVPPFRVQNNFQREGRRERGQTVKKERENERKRGEGERERKRGNERKGEEREKGEQAPRKGAKEQKR
jgi:hypothetical protein